MELEQALGLKKGTVVIAGSTNANPAITGGKSYTLLADAQPVYLSRLHGAARQPHELPCNCEIVIKDDRGRTDSVDYILFRVPQ